MFYKIFGFWIVIIGLVAARAAYHDRIGFDAGEPRPAAHTQSSMLR